MRSGLRLLPLVVLLACLTATVGGWQLSRSYAEAHAEADLTAEAVELETILQGRMRAYEQVLHGGVGLFASSEKVTRDEWRTYVEAIQLNERFPGFQGIGFAVYLRPDEVAEHEATVRAEGFPSYNVTPPGPREEYSAIVYLEPFDARNRRAFGFDMMSESVRHEAMARARDNGEPALSRRVTLVQENGTDVQSGFLLYAPVYRTGAPLATLEERRAAFEGWVYSPFRSRDFVDGLKGADDDQVRLTIYDGPEVDPDHLLYESPNKAVDERQRVVTMDIAGRPWTIVEEPTATTAAAHAYLPTTVLLGGLVMSALLFGISYVLVETNARATTIASRMTAELRARTRELESSNEALRQFNYVVTHDLKEPLRGIDVYLKVLDEDFRDTMAPDARSILTRARAASARLANLLGALLELSHSQRETLTLTAVDPIDVLQSEQCRSSYETIARERGAEVEARGSPAVLAAPGVLAQALGNLVGNAIRHNTSEAPRVLVVGRAAGAGVELRVEDNGSGFPDQFIRSYEAGRIDARGFGILLARQSVERLGGRLALGRSAELGGAAVSLILPAAVPPTSAPGSFSSTRPRTRGSSSASR